MGPILVPYTGSITLKAERQEIRLTDSANTTQKSLQDRSIVRKGFLRVGSRVKITEPLDSCYGKIGVVTQIDEDGDPDVKFDDDEVDWYNKKCLEFVEPDEMSPLQPQQMYQPHLNDRAKYGSIARNLSPEGANRDVRDAPQYDVCETRTAIGDNSAVEWLFPVNTTSGAEGQVHATTV